MITIAGEVCQLDFSGFLQVVNTSAAVKTVVCGKELLTTFALQPGETYYLENIKGRFYLIRDNDLSPADNFIRFLSGDCTVNCFEI